MTPTFVHDDAAAPHRAPGERGYRIYLGDRLRGVVAGSARSWYAGPIPPSRTRIPSWTVWAETRKRAVERFIQGRP